MQAGEEQEITIENFFKLAEEEKGTYQILSPGGWQDIGSLVQKQKEECYNLIFENGQELSCSSDHYIWTIKDSDGAIAHWEKTEDINVEDDLVFTMFGWQSVVAKEFIGAHRTFDLEVKSSDHSYYANHIVSHNTGKSMVSDALASLYEMPLLRLDIGALFSAHIGESEENTRNAIQTVEAISPAILWIDEIEKGIGGVQSSNQTDGGVTNRVFGTILTWMQEKTCPVFIIATANNLKGIPPEFQRAGRFDEMFFLDLPNHEQRMEVLKCLLLKKGRVPEDFDLHVISSSAENYSPAELEKGIDNALFIAYADSKRGMTTQDIVSEIGKFQPLYNSRHEEIQEMKEWALGIDGQGGRARLANSVSVKKNYTPKDTGRQIDISEDDL